MEPNKKASDARLQPAQVAKITGLVDYQSGSVVTREIFKMPTGSVTIFAFDEGQADINPPRAQAGWEKI